VDSVLPFFAVLSDPGVVSSNRHLAAIYAYLGFSDTRSFVRFLGFVVFVALIGSVAFRAFTTYVLLRFTNMRSYSLSRRLVAGYLRQPFEWFLGRHSADLGKTVLAEVNEVVTRALLPMVQSIAQGIVVLFMVVLLVIVDPLAALALAGVFGGMGLYLMQILLELTGFIEPLPLYIGFPLIAILSTVITIVVSLLTEQTDIETLKNFYRKVQPAGAWQPAKEAVLAETPDFKKQSDFKLDFFNVVFSLIGITALYVSMLYLILHRLEIGFGLLGITLVTVVILYFTWYKNLPPPSAPPSEDAENFAEEAN